MSHYLEILKVIEGALKLDKAKVISYASLLSDKMDNNGEKNIATKIRKTINANTKEKTLSPVNLNSISKVPVDQESRLSIADILIPEEIDTNIVLNENNKKLINNFLLSYEKKDLLVSSGLELPNTILLYGPPGCGKTELSKFLAKQMGLPLVIARLDSIISSFLGSTAKNIRSLFEYAQKIPCVLFLDEFDALAKIRDDSNELGELKRVVNSLLQNIDFMDNGSILIAATNHEQLLDSAVWRRFNYKINVKKPTFNSRLRLIKLFLNNKLSDEDIKLAAYIFEDLSGSEIEEISMKSLRDSIINSIDIDISLLIDNYFNYFNLTDDINDKRTISRMKAVHIRNKNEKIFSYAKIGRILNFSKTYIGKLVNEAEEGKDNG